MTKQQRLRDRRKSAGKCIDCGVNPPFSNRLRCCGCLRKIANYARLITNPRKREKREVING